MNAIELREWAADKERFTTLADFLDFARAFLEFRRKDGFQAELTAVNNKAYRFFQYGEDVDSQLTRPINTSLFYESDHFDAAARRFYWVLDNVMSDAEISSEDRDALSRVIYTSQQAIGSALDALPARRYNTARKINGDLFERFIMLTIQRCRFACRTGMVSVPIADVDGNFLFSMKYQHDLIVEDQGTVKAIGSVKTSSKDRLGKVFIDKFLYNRMTEVETPHFAIFLHDVQRAGHAPNYRISSTFSSGRFKGYSVKLDPLDGVYYCDLLPQMRNDPQLSDKIRRIDHFYATDLPAFISWSSKASK